MPLRTVLPRPPIRKFKPTKGRQERDVPMSPTLAAELRAYRMASGRRDGLIPVRTADGRSAAASCKSAPVPRGRPRASSALPRTSAGTCTRRSWPPRAFRWSVSAATWGTRRSRSRSTTTGTCSPATRPPTQRCRRPTWPGSTPGRHRSLGRSAGDSNELRSDRGHRHPDATARSLPRLGSGALAGVSGQKIGQWARRGADSPPQADDRHGGRRRRGSTRPCTGGRTRWRIRSPPRAAATTLTSTAFGRAARAGRLGLASSRLDHRPQNVGLACRITHVDHLGARLGNGVYLAFLLGGERGADRLGASLPACRDSLRQAQRGLMVVACLRRLRSKGDPWYPHRRCYGRPGDCRKPRTGRQPGPASSTTWSRTAADTHLATKGRLMAVSRRSCEGPSCEAYALPGSPFCEHHGMRTDGDSGLMGWLSSASKWARITRELEREKHSTDAHHGPKGLPAKPSKDTP